VQPQADRHATPAVGAIKTGLEGFAGGFGVLSIWHPRNGIPTDSATLAAKGWYRIDSGFPVSQGNSETYV